MVEEFSGMMAVFKDKHVGSLDEEDEDEEEEVKVDGDKCDSADDGAAERKGKGIGME